MKAEFQSCSLRTTEPGQRERAGHFVSRALEPLPSEPLQAGGGVAGRRPCSRAAVAGSPGSPRRGTPASGAVQPARARTAAGWGGNPRRRACEGLRHPGECAVQGGGRRARGAAAGSAAAPGREVRVRCGRRGARRGAPEARGAPRRPQSSDPSEARGGRLVVRGLPRARRNNELEAARRRLGRAGEAWLGLCRGRCRRSRRPARSRPEVRGLGCAPRGTSVAEARRPGEAAGPGRREPGRPTGGRAWREPGRGRGQAPPRSLSGGGGHRSQRARGAPARRSGASVSARRACGRRGPGGRGRAAEGGLGGDRGSAGGGRGPVSGGRSGLASVSAQACVFMPPCPVSVWK